MKVAVIGVGHLGRHHARILAGLPGIELVAVVDINQERAAEVAATHGTRACVDWKSVLGAVDAVTIAAPTEVHASIAGAFLEHNVHVLVEKPMTATTTEADELLRLSRQGGVVLAVGHTERFNPAVAQARLLVREPRFIEVHRLGTFPDRSLDIDVVFDLMIHDLDLGTRHRRRGSQRGRGGRRAGVDSAGGYRQRPAAVCQWLHCQPDGQPDQPGPSAQDSLFPA